MTVRLLAWAVALALVAARPPAAAAGMPEYGTKNFTPSPATPSYLTGERDIPAIGPQPPVMPASRAPLRKMAMPARPAVTTAAPVPARISKSRAVRSRSARRRRLKMAHLYRASAARLRRKPAHRR